MSFFNDVEREVVVTGREAVARNIVALEIAASNGRPLPVWEPGAHIDAILAPGVERQYSLCSPPEQRDRWRIAVLREPEGRGGSTAAHGLRVGDVLRVRGPRSTFPSTPLGPGDRAVFVAGGIGITPILSMIRAAESTGADWTLFYAVRSRDALPFAEELAGYGARVRLHVSDEGTRIDLTAVLAGAGSAPVWACGPERMLAALEEAASPQTRLHTEPFTAGDLAEPVWREPFEVELASTGEVVTVPPDRSILEAVEATGAFTVSSCREGTCGTCETVVIEGDVDHRDRVLTEEERASSPVMMICVSRAACPRLVLDL